MTRGVSEGAAEESGAGQFLRKCGAWEESRARGPSFAEGEKLRVYAGTGEWSEQEKGEVVQ